MVFKLRNLNSYHGIFGMIATQTQTTAASMNKTAKTVKVVGVLVLAIVVTYVSFSLALTYQYSIADYLVPAAMMFKSKKER